MRNRSGVVISNERAILLIKRVKKDQTYYVLPGGGVKPGETFRETAVREALEELDVRVELNKEMARIDDDGIQVYYDASIVSGKLQMDRGILDSKGADGQGTYELVWKNRLDCSQIMLYPEAIVQFL